MTAMRSPVQQASPACLHRGGLADDHEIQLCLFGDIPEGDAFEALLADGTRRYRAGQGVYLVVSGALGPQTL